jgi:predicted membrane protein (TIGR00267 family)
MGDGVKPQKGKNKPARSRAEKHKHIPGRGLISSMALGISDGLVTNLSLLTGFGGAVAAMSLIRFAGLAAMLAGTVSMFFGGILAARSEHDLFNADAKREGYEIEHEPEEEWTELFELYKEKGLTDDEARLVVTRIASSKEKFLEDILTNELHIHKANLENAVNVGGVVGASFFVGSLVPLIPYYLFAVKTPAIYASLVLSLTFLFAVGVVKGRIANRSIWRSGVEMLLVGAVATLMLFLIGSAFVFA